MDGHQNANANLEIPPSLLAPPLWTPPAVSVPELFAPLRTSCREKQRGQLPANTLPQRRHTIMQAVLIGSQDGRQSEGIERVVTNIEIVG